MNSHLCQATVIFLKSLVAERNIFPIFLLLSEDIRGNENGWICSWVNCWLSVPHGFDSRLYESHGKHFLLFCLRFTTMAHLKLYHIFRSLHECCVFTYTDDNCWFAELYSTRKQLKLYVADIPIRFTLPRLIGLEASQTTCTDAIIVTAVSSPRSTILDVQWT